MHIYVLVCTRACVQACFIFYLHLHPVTLLSVMLKLAGRDCNIRSKGILSILHVHLRYKLFYRFLNLAGDETQQQWHMHCLVSFLPPKKSIRGITYL